MRLIDADNLKKCAIPCEIHNGALTDLCVPLYQVDNAPTVDMDERDTDAFETGYVHDYTDSCVLFTNDIKNFINKYNLSCRTDFTRGFNAALKELKEYFEFRGFVFDENSNQDTV